MKIYLNQSDKVRIRNSLLGILGILVGAFVVYYIWFMKPMEEVYVSPIPDLSLLENQRIKENTELYRAEDRFKVYEMYVTVFNGPDAKTGEIFNLQSLNLIDGLEPDPQLDAFVQIKDPDTGHILLGNTGSEVNSTLSQRGQSARLAEQKSYKIKVFDNQGTFQGQQVLNLNKHTFDNSRAAQKFCMDQMAYFPDMVSLRTNFFRVYIKDGTQTNSAYVNYGLFTHVEQPNKTFLSDRGLDTNGSLYKPSDFEFFESPYILPVNDPEFDEDMFRLLLKIRENPDNIKLARMLKDINDLNLDFSTVFQKYFDLDNYLTWCAMNILFNNYDTMSRNFLLYSPSYSEKWYFLPWDFDSCLLGEERFNSRSLSEYFGIALYWGTPLHKRFFSNPDHVLLLNYRVDEIYQHLMSEDWETLVPGYTNAILSGYKGSLDEMIKDTEPEDIVSEIADYQNRITFYYNLYYTAQERPMPFFLGTPKQDGNEFQFNWSPSADLQVDRMSYEFSIFTDYNQRQMSVVFQQETSLTKISVEQTLPDGQYYWSAIVRDAKGNWQRSYDRYRIENPDGTHYYQFGLKPFQIVQGLLVTKTD